jgi:hypothetical protein
MEDWLKHTAAYIPTWIDYQLRCSEQVGCLLAIVHEGKLVLEYAAGSANLAGAEPLTPGLARNPQPGMPLKGGRQTFMHRDFSQACIDLLSPMHRSEVLNSPCWGPEVIILSMGVSSPDCPRASSTPSTRLEPRRGFSAKYRTE